MASDFWDIQGVLFIDYLTEERTMNAAYYSELLQDQSKVSLSLKTTKLISQKPLSPPQRASAHRRCDNRKIYWLRISSKVKVS
jgi:hypothetical protein